MRIAHLSDLHIGSSPAAARRAHQAVQYLESLSEDVAAVVVTGDVADHGTRDEYLESAQLLASRFPTFCCPGNHDERRAFEEAFLGDRVSEGPVNRARTVPGATFLMCDSTVPGADHGELTQATLAWMEHQLALAPADDHVFVAVHHPPVPLGLPGLDQILLSNPAALEALLARSRPVAAILCGHAHAAAAGSLGPTPVRVAPGVASTSRLPFERGAALDDSLPPGIAFHLVNGAAPLITHFRTLARDADR